MRLLDLFCKAGGAAMGYHRAGFEVVGVDIEPQPHYPFEFHQADAMTYPLEGFDAIHASPPCQAYTSMRHSDDHPDLYGATRDRLLASGVPWVIENVIGAPYHYGLILCGSMFDLQIRRHRNFETSWLMFQPPCHHNGERPYTITGKGDTKAGDFKHSRHPAKADGPRLMGMPWASWDEVTQAVPPPYTYYIGCQLLKMLYAT